VSRKTSSLSGGGYGGSLLGAQNAPGWVPFRRSFPTNTGTFEAYVEEVLVPELKPGDVVVWDNLKPHQSEDAIEAVEEAGAEVVPLPPYSPDYTPIEEMFSKVKGAMRSAAGRTKEAVYAAFGSALHDVTPKDIAGWFQDRAAYAMQL
jgi:transposase